MGIECEVVENDSQYFALVCCGNSSARATSTSSVARASFVQVVKRVAAELHADRFRYLSESHSCNILGNTCLVHYKMCEGCVGRQ